MVVFSELLNHNFLLYVMPFSSIWNRNFYTLKEY